MLSGQSKEEIAAAEKEKAARAEEEKKKQQQLGRVYRMYSRPNTLSRRHIGGVT